MSTIVGGKLLSVSVKVLLEKIVSVDFVDVSFLKRLKTTMMWDILNDDDVEEKRFTNPYVKNWLDILDLLSLKLTVCLTKSTLRHRGAKWKQSMIS
jgi:hypothetical protein